MADLLSSGVSALLAFRRNLTVTGHNIANVNTPGYSRQRVDMSARPPEMTGSGYLGTGVKVDTVRRLYNDFIAQRVRASGSEQHRLDTFHKLAGAVDNLLANGDAGVAPGLQQLYAAFEDVSNDPSSTSVRQSLLSRANSLATRFHNLSGQIDQLEGRANSQVRVTVNEINALAGSIAKLNGRIAIARGAAGGQPPNDLLDKRDNLVDQLSAKVGVKTVAQDDGAYNVFIGNGQALVVGNHANELTTQQNAYDPARLEVAVVTGGSSVVVTGQIGGGSLGGALDARREVLDPARDALGRAAFGLVSSVNAQHRRGMDLNGNLGGDFFSVSPAEVRANSNNTGTAGVAVTLDDAAQLTGHDYMLKYDGANWRLSRLDTGAAVTMTGNGSAANPFEADGMQIVVSGAASAGDRYSVRPTAGAARSLSVAVDNPTEVAAAAPIRTSASGANTGDATIGDGRVVDITDPNLLASATIQFTSPTTYTINGGTAQTYTSGDPITFNGWQVEIDGAPQTGDTFTVESNAGGVGDNRNALALGKLQSEGVLDGGNSSVSDAYEQLVAKVGTQTRQAESNLDAQKALHTQALGSQQSISGVNLDEEAANLVKFQQSYLAAAHTISVAETVFQSLMTAIR